MRNILFWLFVLAAFLLPPRAGAEPRYFGRLSTVLETYETFEGEDALSFHQYLNLTVDDPLKREAGNYFYFYGRYAKDLNEKDDFLESRIYSAFLNVKEVLPGADLRLGRQFIYTVAGSALADGVELRAHEVGGRANLRVFAGGDARFDADYSSGDWLMGGSVDIMNIPETSLGLSFFQRHDGWDVSRRAVGLYAGRSLNPSLKLYGEARYDLISEILDTFLIEGKLFTGKSLTTSLGYYYNVPVFDATDIYSVFAVDEYKEAFLRSDYRLNEWVSLFGSYTHAFYDETEDSDSVELGALMRKHKEFSLFASAFVEEGEDDMLGGRLNARYHASDDLSVGAGLESDSYRRRQMEESDSASRYFFDSKYYISPKAHLYARVEGLKSIYSDNDIRMRIKFSYAF